MDKKLAFFWQELCGKKVAVCGIGISNTPLIELLLKKGAKVTACDRRNKDELGNLADQLTLQGVTLQLGEGYLASIDAQIIFRTPGMPFFLPALNEYRAKGVTVTSEMELFFQFCPARTIAVTGSDGKTTTTTLIAEMLKSAGKKVYIGGNIGEPMLPKLEEMEADSFAVVELSSFQLVSMNQSPDIAVVTNLAPNHLDIHKDMDEYIEAKKNILRHQNAFSKAILNFDNDITRDFCTLIRGDTLFFSRRKKMATGAFALPDGSLCFSRNGEITNIMHQSDIMIPGEHNIENYLAAICAVWGEVSPERIRSVARTFGGVEHRIELVRELCGVRYYNDSIASSPTRTIAGLNAFTERVILIAGGYDKHIPFEPLALAIAKRVKCLILMGATADMIEAAVKSNPDWDANDTIIIRVENMEQAVAAARTHARNGDVVTMSPACASFDMYPNFAERGNHFKSIVRNLSAE